MNILMLNTGYGTYIPIHKIKAVTGFDSVRIKKEVARLKETSNPLLIDSTKHKPIKTVTLACLRLCVALRIFRAMYLTVHTGLITHFATPGTVCMLTTNGGALIQREIILQELMVAKNCGWCLSVQTLRQKTSILLFTGSFNSRANNQQLRKD